VTEMQAETRNNHLQSGIDKQAADITAALHAAAWAAIPLREISATRPWISAATLDAIQTRNMARSQGKWMLERSMHRQIKKSAQRDRRRWLNEMIDTGDWRNLQKLKRVGQVSPARLQDARGNFVSSEQRAETLAEYLERVQWRPPPKPEDLDLGPSPGDLPMSNGDFTLNEVTRVLKKLRRGKASGADNVPPDFWSTLRNSTEAVSKLLSLMNACLRSAAIPAEWRTAKVTAIFKKGNDSLPENYRPISLLCVGYKVGDAHFGSSKGRGCRA
jgi:hypothetical protein